MKSYGDLRLTNPKHVSDTLTFDQQSEPNEQLDP